MGIILFLNLFINQLDFINSVSRLFALGPIAPTFNNTEGLIFPKETGSVHLTKQSDKKAQKKKSLHTIVNEVVTISMFSTNKN